MSLFVVRRIFNFPSSNVSGKEQITVLGPFQNDGTAGFLNPVGVHVLVVVDGEGLLSIGRRKDRQGRELHVPAARERGKQAGERVVVQLVALDADEQTVRVAAIRHACFVRRTGRLREIGAEELPSVARGPVELGRTLRAVRVYAGEPLREPRVAVRLDAVSHVGRSQTSVRLQRNSKLNRFLPR